MCTLPLKDSRLLETEAALRLPKSVFFITGGKGWRTLDFSPMVDDFRPARFGIYAYMSSLLLELI